jgi:hypothetical protein
MGSVAKYDSWLDFKRDLLLAKEIELIYIYSFEGCVENFYLGGLIFWSSLCLTLLEKLQSMNWEEELDQEEQEVGKLEEDLVTSLRKAKRGEAKILLFNPH